MKWSWKLGTIAGIATYVHASFLLLVVWAAWAAYAGAGSGWAALLGVCFLLAVFASVLMHELGHALVARRYGVATRHIVLLPIGGMAQLEGDPETPRQEIAVALAGPAVNFVLAAILFAADFALRGVNDYAFVDSLMLANLSLGVFNLVPAFPMDGGRALRAALSLRLGGRRATRYAVFIGKSGAVALAIGGLLTSMYMLAFIAAFVFVAAHIEGRRYEDMYDEIDAYEAGIWSPEQAWESATWPTSARVPAMALLRERFIAAAMRIKLVPLLWNPHRTAQQLGRA